MKRFALVIYKSKYDLENYTDHIYRSGDYDSKEHTVVLKETNSFKRLMKMWDDNFKY
jgi:hypothetical protein